MSGLCKGVIITIYEDPYTQRKPEGRAELVSLIDRDEELGTERWNVRFEARAPGDADTYERTIVCAPQDRAS